MSENLSRALAHTRDQLSALAFHLSPVKSIAYGAQFAVEADGVSGTVRIYDGKKGIRIDLSQVGPALRNRISPILDESPKEGPLSSQDSMRVLAPMIGTDESGKGDYFGPLVVGAVGVDEKTEKELIGMGVRDSKEISDSGINKLAAQIREVAACSVYCLMPVEYNQEYKKFKNLNLLLAQGHAQAALPLIQETGITRLVLDQFAQSIHLKGLPQNCEIHLFPRAESRFPAVAAASIIARERFVLEMENLSRACGTKLPKGNSEQVVRAARKMKAQDGIETLAKFAKMHFKTTENLG